VTGQSGPPAVRPPADDELVSVVVCTLGREHRLGETLSAVLGQTHRQLELLVVDNDPGSGRTAALMAEVEDFRLRIVPEPVRGLSAARNAGLAAACGALVAYTDDDAVPDPGWITALLDVLRLDGAGVVTCVTGRVLAAGTATAEEEWFEDLGVFDKGAVRTAWFLDAQVPAALGVTGHHSAFFPYTAGEMGSGNNMLFRTEALRKLGGFDEALGAGTPAKGGEDLDVFRRVVLAGQVLVYAPEALVRHHHRGTYEALRTQMFGYGIGMAASLAKVVLHGGRPALTVLGLLPRGVYVLLAPSSTKNVKNPVDTPTGLLVAELLGYAVGPVSYVRGVAASRWRRRRARRRLRR
jgi:GT2 family glycosyltransferase